MSTVYETPILSVHLDPCEEVGGVEREHRLSHHVHGGLHDGLVHGFVHLLSDLSDLRGLRLVLDLHLLSAEVREGQGEQPHGLVVVSLHVGLGVANASAILPLVFPEFPPRQGGARSGR